MRTWTLRSHLAHLLCLYGGGARGTLWLPNLRLCCMWASGSKHAEKKRKVDAFLLPRRQDTDFLSLARAAAAARPAHRKEGKRASQKRGARGGLRAFWSAFSLGAADRRDPTASVCNSSKRWRGAPRRTKFGIGGRRPDQCLLVPNASRQEAEAN